MWNTLFEVAVLFWGHSYTYQPTSVVGDTMKWRGIRDLDQRGKQSFRPEHIARGRLIQFPSWSIIRGLRDLDQRGKQSFRPKRIARGRLIQFPSWNITNCFVTIVSYYSKLSIWNSNNSNSNMHKKNKMYPNLAHYSLSTQYTCTEFIWGYCILSMCYF